MEICGSIVSLPIDKQRTLRARNISAPMCFEATCPLCARVQMDGFQIGPYD